MYLNVHSHYSLRYGTAAVTQLVEAAVQYGITTLALTDINNSSGSLEFVKACREAGINPAVGIEFRNEAFELLYIGLARNAAGFEALNEFLSEHRLQGKPLPQTAPILHAVCWIIPYNEAVFHTSSPRDDLFWGIRASQVNQLKIRHLDHSRLVAWEPMTFLRPTDHEVHRYLRAIDRNILLSRLAPTDLAAPDELLRPLSHLLRRFEALPRLVMNAMSLLESCSFEFDFKVSKNKRTFSATTYDDKLLLEKLAYDGLKYRYGEHHAEAKRRVQHELDIIDRLGFASYFLITWDIIRYSMGRGFYHVGRGSGANSVVAFCLRITDVDPIELDLYFERFLNPKRSSPPDFDIDYSWKERDEVLEYIFRRYGHKHTALLGTMSTFKDRSIYRELGKVVGLPKAEIDALVEDRKHPGERDHVAQQVAKIGKRIEQMPNQRSIHAGGVLISEAPVFCYTALDMPPKGFPVVQWDMYTAEEIGFEKFDILSQRGIGHIKDAAALVLRNRGLSIDVHRIAQFKQDEQVRAQLQRGDTIGCFYVESPAMRGLLKKLHCDHYISLVAASSIIRPGVARSGMMKAYIERFHHPEKIKYLHPVMQEQLGETYGVMVFQEDVLKVCHHYAGLDLADADVLRRAMSGKYRSKKEFERIVAKFFDNSRALGRDETITREVWRQVESFAGYSFSKAHSASFAVESFQSLYLKAHYPMEFMVAVINNFGGFYQTRIYVNELRKAGADVRLPCVNQSEYTTNISGMVSYLGLIHVASLEYHTVERLLEARTQDGPFAGMEDLVARTGISLDQLLLLIRCGALRFTGESKKALLWKAHGLLSKVKAPTIHAATPLFAPPSREYRLPALASSPVEDAFDELELLGFSLTLSPFDLLQTKFRGPSAKQLTDYIGKQLKVVGDLVTWKPVRTVKGEPMAFGTFIDAEGNFFDTVHFPDTLKQYPFRKGGCYLLQGKVVEEFGFPSIEIEKMAKLSTLSDPRY